jgi:hypothetical protein
MILKPTMRSFGPPGRGFIIGPFGPRYVVFDLRKRSYTSVPPQPAQR